MKDKFYYYERQFLSNLENDMDLTAIESHVMKGLHNWYDCSLVIIGNAGEHFYLDFDINNEEEHNNSLRKIEILRKILINLQVAMIRARKDKEKEEKEKD